MPIECSDQKLGAPVFDFSRLESLRLLCKEIQQDQVNSLQYFEFDAGYQHFRGKNQISASSTATCILSLVATGKWADDKLHTKVGTKGLLEKLIARKKSAGLDDNNPFTLAWVLEAFDVLKPYSDSLDAPSTQRIAEIEGILLSAVKRGGVSIEPYPPSAYLTQLVVRALRKAGKLTPELDDSVSNWAWSELARQLALIQAKSKTQDAFAVAYLLMLVTAATPSLKISPEQTSIQHTALKVFFDSQLPDGTWPLSRPLFHYPKYGNAYCYEYEMLTQLLLEPKLRDLLLGYLPNLSAAAESVLNSVYRVEGGIAAWTSGHHPNQAEPESWTTASVYHFIHQLDRLLAEAVRRELFRYLECPLPRLAPSKSKDEKDFAPDFLDSTLDAGGNRGQSLRNFLWEKFAKPLSLEADGIVDGRKFSEETPRSAIFFGPPGTSKTELSRKIADFLGWPLLVVDPSLLLRKGMDGIQAEANSIFRMLEWTERVVVLFDEFDELVRERGISDSEPFSRLLTTAMLPKLATIHKRATLVFIIATNHVGEFDLAIRRRGRFDRVVQIMPPTYEAKMAKKSWGPTKNVDLAEKLQQIHVDLTDEIKGQIGDLTYDECEQFVIELSKIQSAQGATSALATIWGDCTLQTRLNQGEEVTWADRCKAEATLSH